MSEHEREGRDRERQREIKVKTKEDEENNLKGRITKMLISVRKSPAVKAREDKDNMKVLTSCSILSVYVQVLYY